MWTQLVRLWVWDDATWSVILARLRPLRSGRLTARRAGPRRPLLRAAQAASGSADWTEVAPVPDGLGPEQHKSHLGHMS